MKLTPKQKVLAKYPDAFSTALLLGGTGIFLPTSLIWKRIGAGKNPRQAWADAARKLP